MENPSIGQSSSSPLMTFVLAPQIEYCDKLSLVSCVISKLYGDQARFFDPEKAPRIKHRKKGTVSMVNNGNEQHGSQVNKMYIHTAVCPVKRSRAETTEEMSNCPGFGLTFDFKVTIQLDFGFKLFSMPMLDSLHLDL